jgi:glycosyltransferase involved in cell wall biosynthesis
MRVLMITQVVDLDNPVLGFTHTWVNALARRVEQLHVVTLAAGKHNLADNVVLHTYGPPGMRHNRLNRWWFYNRCFASLILGAQVDVVFVHMIPRWVIMVAPYARIRHVPIVLWYVHRQVTFQLKLAHWLATRVVTASSESCRLKSEKVVVLGHGIDTELFRPVPDIQPTPRSVIAVGRLAPIKDYETLIHAAHILVHGREQQDWRFTIVGEADAATANYADKLHALVADLGLQAHVTFVGAVPNYMMPALYQSHFASVNLCPTGGMDKVVLESLACGTPAIVCNRTFTTLLGENAGRLLFREGDAEDLATKLEVLATSPSTEHLALGQQLRAAVVREHSVERLMDSIVNILEQENACYRHDRNG